jgi:hypothetical protein
MPSVGIKRGNYVLNMPVANSPPLYSSVGDGDMLREFKAVSAASLSVALLLSTSASAATCRLVKATHSAMSQADAAEMSRELALQSANDLKRANGWNSVSLTAYKVAGDPFWKAVRPDGVPDYAQLKPDSVTPRFYTTCFTGVVVPYVCTTGSSVCGE